MEPEVLRFPPLHVLVEGWTKYPHSYNTVNVYQLLALSKIPATELVLYFRDVEPFKKDWPVIESMHPLAITAEEEATLKAIKRFDSAVGAEIDIVYRIAFPHDLSPPKDCPNAKVVVFFTAEFRVLTDVNFAQPGGCFERFRDMLSNGKIAAVTPASWNLNCFTNATYFMQRHALTVVPHGVDITKFFPDPDARNLMRSRINASRTDVVFLNIGAMTGNKNIIHLIKSFYDLCVDGKHDNVRLILKGINSMYNCERQIGSYVSHLVEHGWMDGAKFRDKVGSRITYIDGAMDYNSMRALLNAADCYVSPYMGEGFNLPVLEAQACGTPIIVPKGGATEDFVHPDCAMFLDSNIEDVPKQAGGEGGSKWIVTSHTQLTEFMAKVADGVDTVTAKCQEFGPKHVEEHYTWDIVARQLVHFFKDTANRVIDG